MAYRGLTKVGANYLATRIANNLPVEFVKVVIGSGIVPQDKDPADTNDLFSPKQEAKILAKSQVENAVDITIQVTNEKVEDGYYLKEIGVFVNDNGENKLYWYCNEDNAQYIPRKTDVPINFEIDIKMEVTNIDSPIINWDGTGTWITKEYLDKIVKDLETELNKIATPTELGRIKVGNNLTITEDGILNGLVASPESVPPIVEKYKGAGA